MRNWHDLKKYNMNSKKIRYPLNDYKYRLRERCTFLYMEMDSDFKKMSRGRRRGNLSPLRRPHANHIPLNLKG